MTKTSPKIRFDARLLRPAEPSKSGSWFFLILPKSASAKLPSRGMTSVEGTINGHPFRATLEPDGQKSHWLKVTSKMREAAGVEVGDMVELEIAQAEKEPEPRVPADLRKAPLLHLTTRPDAWEHWLRLNDAPAENVQGMLLDQFATVAQVARAGLGVALLPTFLIEEELATGQLVRALDIPMKNAEAYYLAWPEDRAEHPPLAAFRDWILRETQQDLDRGFHGLPG